MYDNVHIWIDRGLAGEKYPAIPSRLENVKEVTDRQTGETTFYGHLDGLKVNVFEGGLNIIGSLCKFLNGSNIFTLSRKTTKTAVEKLSDEMGFNVSPAKVTYVEFGTSFILSCPVIQYLKRLGYMNNMLRQEHESLSYTTRGVTDSKIFTFYDKARELKKRKESLPAGFDGLNILRYEMRFKHRLPYQLSWPEVNLRTLSDKDFYKMMVSKYQSEYFGITKQQRLRPKAIQQIKTATDAFNVLVAALISHTDKSQISCFFDDIQASNHLSKTEIYRLRTKIKKVSELDGFTERDELISELDDAIVNTGVYL